MKVFSKKAMTAFAALAMCCGSLTANAAVIEQSADRYIINVDQMDLNGEERLLDILMMLPDVMTVDGKQPINGGLHETLFGQYAVRVDNMNIQIDPEVFVQNTKAREIKCIKVCVNPGIQKGCGRLKQVIDIYYRSNEEGNKGRVALEADSYGQAGLFATDWVTGKNYTLHTYAIGGLEHKKFDGVKEHASKENLRAHLNWNITDKDNLIITAAQGFKREKANGEGNPAAYTRSVNFDACYTRDLGNSAYAMFQVGADYNHGNGIGSRTLNTNPYGLIELGAPFISKNLFLNGGIETGYSGTTETIGSDDPVTSRERYEDFYAQLDWNCGKFNLSIGDRLRMTNKWVEGIYPVGAERFTHNAVNNHVTVSSWINFNEHNILQGTFARRFDGPNIPVLAALQAGALVTESPIYTSELRYTYQKKDMNIMGIIKNVHINGINEDVVNGSGIETAIDHSNVLQFGITGYWHVGILRLTAGINYNWLKLSYANNSNDYTRFVNLKVCPQFSLSNGFRITSKLIYNSHMAYNNPYYSPANFYAELGASKEFNEHWLVEAKFHDIAGQRTGNRAVTVGATFSF